MLANRTLGGRAEGEHPAVVRLQQSTLRSFASPCHHQSDYAQHLPGCINVMLGDHDSTKFLYPSNKSSISPGDHGFPDALHLQCYGLGNHHACNHFSVNNVGALPAHSFLPEK